MSHTIPAGEETAKDETEYYDVIFFNDNNKDGFLRTLDENIIEKMLDDKIDTIISLREEDEEFSVTEVNAKNDWSHFKGDRMKITKILKTLTNRFAELNPSSDISLVRLYGLQEYYIYNETGIKISFTENMEGYGESS
ncbi:7419_t:CDS:2, partial [Funneliformis geosporum]